VPQAAKQGETLDAQWHVSHETCKYPQKNWMQAAKALGSTPF